MTTDLLSQEFALPCGLKLPNRIVKAAMTEGLADEYSRATPQLETLYSSWSRNNNAGGLLITGNVVVDRRYVERPGNVAIDGKQTEEQLAALQRYAKAATKDNTRCIVQLSHAGRQCNALVNKMAVAPSAIRVVMNGVPTATPRALTEPEIEDVVARFVHAATVCKQAGFHGVEIHAAHGYLLSSFLSPLANVRDDAYGGSLQNRARLLLRIVNDVRQATGKGFCVAVKLNSSDFQRGGFAPEEAVTVAQWLEAAGVDFLEISGGNYENPSMMVGAEGFSELNTLGKTSTQIREGYFLVFAREVKRAIRTMPLMVTGGFRSRVAMEAALAGHEADLIGVARPVCGDVECVKNLLQSKISELPRYERDMTLPWYLQPLRYVVVGNLLWFGGLQMWFYESLIRIGNGLQVQPDANLLATLMRMDATEKATARALKGKELQGVVGLETNAVRDDGKTPIRFLFMLFAVFLVGFAWQVRVGERSKK